MVTQSKMEEASTGQSSGPPSSSAQPEQAAGSAQSRRRRVGKACDECRKRKTRCDGRQPCLSCSETHRGWSPLPLTSRICLISTQNAPTVGCSFAAWQIGTISRSWSTDCSERRAFSRRYWQIDRTTPHLISETFSNLPMIFVFRALIQEAHPKVRDRTSIWRT